MTLRSEGAHTHFTSVSLILLCSPILLLLLESPSKYIIVTMFRESFVLYDERKKNHTPARWLFFQGM